MQFSRGSCSNCDSGDGGVYNQASSSGIGGAVADSNWNGVYYKGRLGGNGAAGGNAGTNSST